MNNDLLFFLALRFSYSFYSGAILISHVKCCERFHHGMCHMHYRTYVFLTNPSQTILKVTKIYRALYHIELRRRGHIMVKMSMTINISLIWIKLRTVCNWQGPYILLVGNQMLRRDLIWLLRMRLSNNRVRVLSLGVLGRKIVIESVLYWVCLLTAYW